MTASERFDRDFADLLADLAQPQLPDYFDEALQLAVSHRQRPAWTFPERWIPMGVLTRRLPLVPAFPSRTMGLLVMLLLLLLATVVIGVGALLLQQQQRPAPPFGLAANGMLAYSHEGDIYTRDPVTGESRLIVGGPTVDVEPWFTRDGTGVLFFRVLETGQVEMIELIIAEVNGANPRTLLGPVPHDDVRWVEVSPDGLLLAIASADTAQLSVLDLDTGARTPLDLPVTVTEFEWTVDGRGLIFRAEEGPDRSALYYVNADGTELRPLTETAPFSGQFMAPFAISHDGRYLAYSSFRGGALSLQLLDLETDEVNLWLSPIGVGMATGWPAFSPDNERIAFINYSLPTPLEISAQAMVGPIDGGTAAAEPVGPLVRIPQLTRGLAVQFSPDGESLLITSDDGDVWQADLEGGTYEALDLPKTEFPPGWQRRAP